MLIEDCNQLSQLAQNVIDFRKYASDLGKFRDRQSKIEALVKELRSVITAMRAFREKGLVNFNCSQKADALLTEVNAALAEFQKERGWLIEKFKGKTFQSFEAKINALKSELESHLRQTWATYKKQRIPNTNLDLLKLLEKELDWQVTVQRVKSRILDINTVDFPQNSSQFQKIDQEIDHLITDWNSLSSDEVPIAIQDFLKAATTHGATLDRFTPEVKAWLDEKGFSRFFYIRVSN